MYRHWIWSLGLLCLWVLPVQAQRAKTKAATRLVKQAEVHMRKGNWKAAKLELEEALRTKPDFTVAHRSIAVIYDKLGDYEAAAAAYEKVFSLDSEFSKAAYFEYAQVLMRQLRYREAERFLQLYKNADNMDYELSEETLQLAYDRVVERDIRNCRFGEKIDYQAIIQEAESLGKSVNSAGDEYLPTLAFYGETTALVFTSYRGEENIYISERRRNGHWKRARSIGENINSSLNEGMAKFTSCGRTVFFAACHWPNGVGGCDIFEAEFADGHAANVRPTAGALNTRGWDSQPAISCDEQTLYFASNREGGYGGTDLWMSRRLPDGSWSAAENLGPNINTPFDEEAPFIASDDITLYFSSDGHAGFGEADIFKATWEQGQWSKPLNLGRGINTPFREAGIAITPDGQHAYFASARTGGQGGLDIYEVDLYRAIEPRKDITQFSGLVQNASNEAPLKEVKVKVNQGGRTLYHLETDEEGRFFICLPSGKSYSFILEKEGYEMGIEATYLKPLQHESARQQANYMLIPKVGTPLPPQEETIVLLYASGQAALTGKQKLQLNQLLNRFPQRTQVQVQVTGFADDVGQANDNQKLSSNRAAQVAKFLQEAGLKETQIKHNGKGVAQEGESQDAKRRVEVHISVQ